MWLFLLTNWRYILTSGLTFALAYFLHSLDVSYLEIKHQNQMQTQKEELVKQCNDDKLKIREASDALRKQNNAYNRLIDNLKLQPSGAMPDSTDSAGTNGSASTGSAESSCTSSGTGREAVCEIIKLRLLQDSIRSIWPDQFRQP